jgi:hypothetical protein
VVAGLRGTNDILEKQFDAAARAAEQSLVPTPQPDTGAIHRLASKDYCPSDVRAYRIYGKGSASLRGQCLDHPVLAFMLGIGASGRTTAIRNGVAACAKNFSEIIARASSHLRRPLSHRLLLFAAN